MYVQPFVAKLSKELLNAQPNLIENYLTLPNLKIYTSQATTITEVYVRKERGLLQQQSTF